MIRLDAGNVLLKPSHRRHLMSGLKRSMRMGQCIGDFAMNISMRRVGRGYEVRAAVHDAAGDFACRSRRHAWKDAVRDTVHDVSLRLHDQLRMARVA